MMMRFVEKVSSLGGVVSTVIDVLQVGIGQFYHGNELKWSEVDYYLQIRQIRIDILNNTRDDIQALFEKDERNLDTNLVVATLMLGFGFGFAMEGTFPDDTGGELEKACRIFYAGTAGLALICPFGAMLGFLECRRRVIYFMKCFNRMNCGIIQQETSQFRHEAKTMERMTGKSRMLTHGLPAAWLCCSRRPQDDDTVRVSPPRDDSCESLCTTEEPVFHIDGPSITSFTNVQTHWDDERMQICMGVHADYLNWWGDWVSGLDHKSKILLTCGILFNVLCCSLLLGIYFGDKYPDTPAVRAVYVAIVVAGLLIAGFFTVSTKWSGPRRAVKRMRHRQDVKPLLEGKLQKVERKRQALASAAGLGWDPSVPSWMAKPLLMKPQEPLL